MTATECFWIEYENDDMGPFAERELAEMALGSDEGQIFASGDRGCTPIVALVSPVRQSTAVEWRGVGLGEERDLARRALARAIAGPDPEPQRSIETLREMGALGEDEMIAPASVGRFFGMDDEPREVGGAFDGFTVTSDADPGL